MGTKNNITQTPTFAAIWELIAALRGDDGCPWDRKQTPSSATVYLIEETFELVEAITADNTADIREEMGDVLFQVLFQMYLYAQEGRFTPAEVLGQNLRKMVHRHPHVFGSDKLETAGEVKQRWREIKQAEKESKGSILDSVPSGLPALMRSYRVSERAAGIGFDWDNLAGVLGQVESEWDEFKDELDLSQSGTVKDKDRATEEFGDILFSMINVARVAGIHPETALSRSTEKFVRRFKDMEAMAAEQGQDLETVDRETMASLWVAAKARDISDAD